MLQQTMPRKFQKRDSMPLDTPAIDRDVALSKCLGSFDFAHVHRVLTALDGDGVPSVEEMKREVGKIVAAAFDTYPNPEPCRHSWKEFHAWRCPGTRNHYCTSGTLNLQYLLSESRETPEPADPKKSKKADAIESVMNGFDFERVLRTMALRDKSAWQTMMTLDEVKKLARGLLTDVWSYYPDERCITSGGFHVWRSPGIVDNVICPKGLEMSFLLEYEYTDLTPQDTK